MEAYYALVKKVVIPFEKAGLDYAFTGALAISSMEFLGQQAQVLDKRAGEVSGLKD